MSGDFDGVTSIPRHNRRNIEKRMHTIFLLICRVLPIVIEKPSMSSLISILTSEFKKKMMKRGNNRQITGLWLVIIPVIKNS